ncbi:hypothetical protein ACLOJK_007634 [Asimina triloba]
MTTGHQRRRCSGVLRPSSSFLKKAMASVTTHFVKRPQQPISSDDLFSGMSSDSPSSPHRQMMLLSACFRWVSSINDVDEEDRANRRSRSCMSTNNATASNADGGAPFITDGRSHPRS